MEQNLQIFGRALGERHEATITVAAAPAMAPLTIRFDEPADASGREGFWVSAASPDAKQLAGWVEQRTIITVSFNVGSAILSFPTVVHQYKRTLLRGWRLRLRFPMAIKLVERRSSKRHPIPLGSLVTGMIRRNLAGVPSADGTTAASKFVAKMIEISSGGASFLCRHSDLVPPLKPNESLHLSLSFGEEPLELTARYRHTRELKTGGLQVGLQFSEASLNAPQIAERIEHLIMVMETRYAELSVRAAMKA